jgi:hypothetical protein
VTTGITQQAQREKQMRRIILAAGTAIGPLAGVCRVVSSKQVRRLASEPSHERGNIVLQTNRRTSLKLLGGAALSAASLPPLPAAAQEDMTVPNSLQNFKRGTVHLLHPERRIVVAVWEDLGRVKMRAADLVTNYNQLKVGQVVDFQWYDYMDFLIAKKTPQVEARAQAIKANGAKLEGIPGMREPIYLWTMSGMVTKVDQSSNTIFIINASGGKPEEPAPDSGEVIQLPPVVTAKGKQALALLQPGEQVTTVWSQQTAIKATIIR